MSADRKKWILRSQDPEKSAILARFLRTTPLVGQILLNRGISDHEEAARFLECRLDDLTDPFLFKGMAQAVERIQTALEQGEKILVYGDYDVDGVTATSLILLFLRDLGVSAWFYIPKRVEEGYGVNKDSLRKFREMGISLVITVDCGISSVEEVAFARTIGMEVIVTDHHEPPSVLPAAAAIINPLQEGCEFPFKFLSGVGLAFYLVAGLRKGLRENGFFANRQEPSLLDFLDLVAVGTIADIVPLSGINRILVKAGLGQINRDPRLGLRTLLKVCGVAEGKVDSSTVAFRIAPKINAAGRLSDAGAGVRLLTTDSITDAETLAGYLDVENVERQRIEERIHIEAEDQIRSCGYLEGRKSLVLSSPQWHPGVIGIVASRLTERYFRPTVLLCLENGVYKGSARGIPGFHLYQGLSLCRDLLLEFGGHKFAAGIRMDPANVDEFRERFEKVVRETVSEDDFVPVLTLDAPVCLEELQIESVARFQEMSPFGAGNPDPVLLIENVEISQARVVGSRHLSFQVRQNGSTISAIAFRMADELENLAPRMDLAAVPEIQHWQGTTSVRLRIRGMRSAANPAV